MCLMLDGLWRLRCSLSTLRAYMFYIEYCRGMDETYECGRSPRAGLRMHAEPPPEQVCGTRSCMGQRRFYQCWKATLCLIMLFCWSSASPCDCDAAMGFETCGVWQHGSVLDHRACCRLWGLLLSLCRCASMLCCCRRDGADGMHAWGGGT